LFVLFWCWTCHFFLNHLLKSPNISNNRFKSKISRPWPGGHNYMEPSYFVWQSDCIYLISSEKQIIGVGRDTDMNSVELQFTPTQILSFCGFK
jgi:hypothetical protein